MESGGIEIEIDLAAERFLLAEKGSEKILVEVKSLNRRSLLYDFHAAIGQYIDYRGVLQDESIERRLYLAISETTFMEMSAKPFYFRRMKENQISVLIVDITAQTIIRWIN